MKIICILLPGVLCFSPVATQTQEPARIFELAEVDTGPLPLNMDEFDMALDARLADRRSAGREVTVRMSIVVGADGIPREITHVRSTNRTYDSTALAAVALLRFAPATADGLPVAVRLDLPVRWQPPSSPPRPVVYGCAGDSIPESAGSVPVYTLNAVHMLGELPRPTNLRALRGELLRLYPEMLSQGGREADVNAEVVVNEQGEVIDSRILRSTDPRFDVATREAVRILRFVPARMIGSTVRTCIQIPVQWRMH